MIIFFLLNNPFAYKNYTLIKVSQGETMDLKGKNIIVTGGGSGIGRAIVEGIIEDCGHGHTIVKGSALASKVVFIP